MRGEYKGYVSSGDSSSYATAPLKLEEAYRRIDSARAAEGAASRAAALAQTSFANGLATQLTVDSALTQQQAARLGFYNALYEYRAAYYDWEIAIGSKD